MKGLQTAETALSSVSQKYTIPFSRVCVAQYGLHQQSGRRRLHASHIREKPATTVSSQPSIAGETPAPGATAATKTTIPHLSLLPLSSILRSYFITSISSSPTLLGASSSVLRRMLTSKIPLFRVDKNPVMAALLRQTFYKQFCCGETEAEVKKAIATLREQGYAGVILEFAMEVLDFDGGNEAEDVAYWRKGMLDTVQMTEPGDFIGLKWSGMGAAAMRRMKEEKQPSERMEEAMHALCKAAAEKNVSLLPSAEETWSLRGFNDWCLKMQRVYNTGGKSVVYCTYQAYLKQTTANLAEHIKIAKDECYTLGIKIVRGAYLGSEQREKIFPTIEDTHLNYDRIASALIHRRYNDVLKPADGTSEQAINNVNVVLATHNAVSVQKAQGLRQKQASQGEALTPLMYGQLQGMADEVSCSLIAAAKANEGNEKAVQERVYKCTTWGPMTDTLLYLLRRASENKDAASRTSDTRNAMGAEIRRRMKATFGLA